MSIYKKSLLAKTFLILVCLVEGIIISIMIKEHDLANLIWAIPVFFGTLSAVTAILQLEIIVDDERIILKFGCHPLYKPKIMKWDDINLVVKDSFAGFTVYRLISTKDTKRRSVNFSGIKNMNLMIQEILKRATTAKFYPENEFLTLKEKQNN